MSLFSAMGVSVSGLSAQRTRAQLLVENLANAETTRTPEGGPYRRKDVVFTTDNRPAAFADALHEEFGGGTGVQVAEVVRDQREPVMRYLPGHPDANQDGYVEYPNVDVNTELVDLMVARRMHEANASVFQAAKGMLRRALEI